MDGSRRGGQRTALAFRFARVEAEDAVAEAALDDFLEPDKSAAADEENTVGVHLDVFLVRMLASALRRNVACRALENFQKRLLHPLARDVARDAHVVRLASDLVDLVDVDDACLGTLHIVFRGLEQTQDDILHVLPDVASLGQGGGVGHGEGHIEDTGQGAGEERLARTGRTDEQDIAFLQLDIVVSRHGDFARCVVMMDALEVVVHRHRERPFGQLLADDEMIEFALDVGRLGHAHAGAFFLRLVLEFLVEDAFAEADAAVADVDAGAGDEFAHLAVALSAERAHGEIGGAGHGIRRARRPGFPCGISPPRRRGRIPWPPARSCSSRDRHRCAPARPACRCAER